MSPASLADVMKTVAQNPNSTIEPARSKSDAPGIRALEVLGEQRGGSTIAKALTLGKTIGEGGMGIVRVATQKSLDREVAVKTVRKDAQGRVATIRLLREAWITGSLEHPNIVPVYDLGLDDDGSPIIVLKRIEGVEWASVMRDADAVRTRFGAADLLEYNLRILIQLCNAVSLAHSRGVLHRDLKPENVMIGQFGEVYLVDWGIAVSLREDPSGRLPLASEATEMAGTPAYMAPEMLGASIGKLSERTDVYLLGAVLHEILTGKPPHHRDAFRQIVTSILTLDVSYGAEVPRELGEIARRAMARDAHARFASADELRWRLVWFLRNRGSRALSG
jgi:serine/threonine-protein kinase